MRRRYSKLIIGVKWLRFYWIFTVACRPCVGYSMFVFALMIRLTELSQGNAGYLGEPIFFTKNINFPAHVMSRLRSKASSFEVGYRLFFALLINGAAAHEFKERT
jgi:hypothetical protein